MAIIAPDASRHLADVMAEVARRLDRPGTVEEQLDEVLQAARDTISPVDAVSITVMHRADGVETIAGTDALVYELDQVQYDLNEGPCLDALRGAPIQRVDEMDDEQRWPKYAAVAADKGIRSQMAVELFTDERSLGGLNLYSRRARAFDEQTRQLAYMFATQAALAMGRRAEVEHLNTALATRKAIGQAIGIVQERFNLDEERAFQFLIRVSRDGNIKLRDVARELVDERNVRAHTKG